LSGTEFAEPIVDSLRARDDVAAIWVDGSRSRGGNDELSDVDLAVAVDDSCVDAFLTELTALVTRELDPVHMFVRGRLLHAITPRWSRLDVLTRTTSELAAGVPGPVAVLFDRDGLVEEDFATQRRPALPLVEEFLRFLGLLPIAAARGEWIGACIAIGAMTGMVVDLMQIENGTTRVGGALRANERLTDVQRRGLLALPALEPARDSVVAVQLALARLLLPMARRVVPPGEYPERMESALREHLARHGFDLDG
jgi:predicted nucleotidyltransferase